MARRSRGDASASLRAVPSSLEPTACHTCPPRAPLGPPALLAAVLNIPARPLEWTGDRTSEIYYREHDWSRIEQYARASMVMLAQVYLKMVGAPLVADEHIVLSD